MKKIFLISDSLSSGGAQRQIVMCANVLSSFGYSVSILVYHNDLFFSRFLNRSVSLISSRRSSALLRKLHLILIIFKNRPDVLISYLLIPGFIGVLPKLILRKRLLFITGERNVSHVPVLLKERVLRLPHSFADLVVCNTETQRRILSEMSYSSKLRYVPNCIDFNFHFRKREYQRSKLIRLIVLGRVELQKNPLVVAKALHLCKNRKLDFSVSVDWYGRYSESSDLFKAVNEYIELHDLQDTLVFKGITNTPSEEMLKYNAFLLPSFHEGCSNALIEAMSVGMPVIASDISDNRLYLNHQSELLFISDNDESLFESIVEFSKKDAFTVSEIGDSNITIARSNFSMENFRKNQMKLLDD